MTAGGQTVRAKMNTTMREKISSIFLQVSDLKRPFFRKRTSSHKNKKNTSV